MSSPAQWRLQDEQDAEALDRAAATPRRLRKTSMPVSVEKLQEELRLVLADLEEKQRDAMLAAQYGSALLQTNDKLRSELEESNMKLDGAFESMAELHQSLADQNTENAQLRTNNVVLLSQVKDAQRENQILLEEIQTLQDDLTDSQHKNKTIHQLQERKKELEEGLEKFYALHEAYEELCEREKILHAKNHQLTASCAQQDDELAQQRDQIAELEGRLAASTSEQVHAQSWKHQVEQLERSLAELQEEKRILQEMPLLSQFGDTHTLRSLLVKNRALLDELAFDHMAEESKSIVDTLIQSTEGADSEGASTAGVNSDGTPTNAFYMLVAILMHRRYEEAERTWRSDASELAQVRDELVELRHEKSTLLQTIERSQKLQLKAEKKFHGLQLQYDESLAQWEQQTAEKDKELQTLREQLRSQAHQSSSRQEDHSNLLKQHMADLAAKEQELTAAHNDKKLAQDELRQARTQVVESNNRGSEFQDIIRRLNMEKGELQQQLSTAQKEKSALQRTKESLQEKVDSLQEQYQRKRTEVDQLTGDLQNLKDVCHVAEEQIELGKEEVELLQKHNDLLHAQIVKERENHTAQSSQFRHEIQELNELIQMMQALEEEQMELEAQVSSQEEGQEKAYHSLRKENMELKKRLHDAHLEHSSLSQAKQHESDQLILLQDELQFLKDQRAEEQSAEESHRRMLHDQIAQLQERLRKAEEARVKDIADLEALKLRTFGDLQAQLAQERSMNQSNTGKVKRMAERIRELEVANQDLVSSMSRMIKDSSMECKRIDELEEQLRLSLEEHVRDADTIISLREEIRLLKTRMISKRPYMTTLPPPTPLVIVPFPMSPEEKNRIKQTSVSTGLNSHSLPSDLNKTVMPPSSLAAPAREEREASPPPMATAEEEQTTETQLVQDVHEHVRTLLSLDDPVEEKQSAQSGLLLCKLINQVVPDTIDERAMNVAPQSESQRRENFTLCLNSAKAIGCDLPEVQAEELLSDNEQVKKLTWEIVRTELLSHVTLRQHPELKVLEQEAELQAQVIDVASLPPEEILLAWVNYHLAHAPERPPVASIHNLSEDLQDLQVQYALLKEVGRVMEVEDVKTIALPIAASREARVTAIERMAESLGCRRFFYPNEADSKQFNAAFLANLFHHHSALQLTHAVPTPEPLAEPIAETDEGTREERAFRLWINSMGIGTFVHNLQTDVRDGLILLKLFDRISPGLVEWKRVNQNAQRMGIYRKVENCTLCIKYGRDLGFSLVGIGGKDIFDGNRKFILALVWQMMQYHLLGILRQVASSGSKLTEKDVLTWANKKITAKYGVDAVVDNLKSPLIRNSLYLARLIECVSPGVIHFDFIASSDDEKALEENAKYVISIARKIGCCIFMVWEDIIELHPKMIFALMATLMHLDLLKNEKK